MGTKYLVDSDDLTYEANRIRAKTGSASLIPFAAGKGFGDAIDAIPSGGGASIDDLCDKSWPTGEITLTTCQTIEAQALYGRSAITKVSSSSVTKILYAAFSWCTNIEEASFPELTSMRTNSSSATYTGNGDFFRCCAKLKKFYAPKLEYIYGKYAFASSNQNYCCASDCVFVFPAIKELGEYTFETCRAQMFDFGPGLTDIRADTFYGRYAVAQRNKTVILRRTASVVAAKSTDSIREITDVYCPNALIASYKTATNWKTRFDGGYITFHAIEGSQYETAYADGTPIT